MQLVAPRFKNSFNKAVRHIFALTIFHPLYGTVKQIHLLFREETWRSVAYVGLLSCLITIHHVQCKGHEKTDRFIAVLG
jgi:hypothetical protein